MGRRAHSAALAPRPPDRLRPPGGHGPTPPRTRWRRSAWPCGSAPPGWRATSGSPPTARPSSTTTGWCARGCASARSPAADRGDLPSHIPTLRGALRRRGDRASTCPSTSRTQPPSSGSSRSPRAGRRRCDRLWLCHHRVEAGGRLAGCLRRRPPRRLDLPGAHARWTRAAGRRARRRPASTP